MAENPLFKNKDQRYYNDFGTGNKIEREDVKQQRKSLLGSTSKPQNQKKDDFLEGFNDPYARSLNDKSAIELLAEKSPGWAEALIKLAAEYGFEK